MSWFTAGHCEDIDGGRNHEPGACAGAVVNCNGKCCGPAAASADPASADREYVARMLRGMGRSRAADAIAAKPDAGDVEALARVLSGASPEFAARAAENHLTQARRLLASDWLAARLDAARAKGAEEALRAAAVHNPDSAWGRMLIARADRVARESR